MRAQSRRDTKPEIELRRLLHASGFRYRVAWPVPGLTRRTIDIAFTRRRVAVTAFGCFWHSCPLHGTRPRANGEWWERKLRRNRERDLETRVHLEGLGWAVIEVWEHEAAQDAFERVVGVLETRCI